LEFADEITAQVTLWVVRAAKVEAENAERCPLRGSACAAGIDRLPISIPVHKNRVKAVYARKVRQILEEEKDA
jgi:hypothetical protein